jgi:phenylacetaldehyde dehydrogenase
MSIDRLTPQARALVEGEHPLLIGGILTIGRGDPFPVESPATGELLTNIHAANLEQLDQAVAAARSALDGEWGRLTGRERGNILRRFADIIDRDADNLAQVMTIDMGQSLRSAKAVIRMLAVELFRYYAGWADKIAGEAFLPVVGAQTEVEFMTATLQEPVGVVGAIIPWNAPAGMIALKLAPALAAGCTVVMKTAELAPLVGSALAKYWQDAGGPAGAFNLIHGLGHDIGAAMAAHPGIDKIAFTGSTEVGKQIAIAATGNLKGVTLELGGKSPFIVFPDVDIATTAPAAAIACFLSSGQACVSASRLFVHNDVHDAFVDKVVESAMALKLGNGLDEDVMLGPLISARQKERVLSYIQSGLDEGATLLCGGIVQEGRGHFVPPTVFADVTPNMRIAREEIFGPVLSIFRFGDEAEMLDIVNDSPFGLSGSVWTNDIQRALRVARAIDAGQIGINVHAAMSVQTPFGGNKQSGWGREFGREGLQTYLKTKAITMKIGTHN